MKVRNAITESAANGYTLAQIMRTHGLTEERVLALLAAAAQGLNSDRDEKYVPETPASTWSEADRIAYAQFTGRGLLPSVSPSKPLGGKSKVIPHVPAKDRLGDHTEASETMQEHLDEHAQHIQRLLDTDTSFAGDKRYFQGYCRNPCTVCGQPIKRTGKRGRPRVTHPACKAGDKSLDELLKQRQECE